MPASASRIAASIPDTPAPITTTRKPVPSGTVGSGEAGANPMSSAAISPYSAGTSSPTASSSSSTRSAPVGDGTAGGRPADHASTASAVASQISSRTASVNPPGSLSSIPRLRVGR